MAEKTAAEAPQEKKSADVKDAAAAPAKRGPKQLILAALLLMGMVIGSASAAVVMASAVMRSDPAADEAAAAEKTPETEVCEFAFAEQLMVNVFKTQQRRFLFVKPVLVFNNRKALETITARQMEVQHVLIGILKNKTLEQLDDPEAPNVLGREIQEMANVKFELNNALTSVYFTQFLVQ